MSQRSTHQYSRTSSYQSVEKFDGSGDEDNWRDVEDTSERRKIQNRLAQRKFREKAKAAREESLLQSQNQAAARNAYSQPDPTQLESDNSHSGLPWGGVSIRHVVERGQSRQQGRHQTYNIASQESSSWHQPQSVSYSFELPSRQRGGGTSYSSKPRSKRDSEATLQQSGSARGRHDPRYAPEAERSRHDISSTQHSSSSSVLRAADRYLS